MKIFRKFLCAVIIAVLAMTFAGCGEEANLPQLDTPRNVTASETGLISWDAVENAQYYQFILNGHSYDTADTSWQVGSTVNDFTYAVVACAKGYLPSAPSETQTFKGKGNEQIKNPLIENLTVSITGNQLVGSEQRTKLNATVAFPDGTTNKKITWSITEGGDYATVDQNGNLTAGKVEEDQDVTVRATSIDNPDKYAERVICVAVQPTLTDEMLATVQDPVISFDGYMDIDLYSFGIFEKFVKTENLYGISTQMKPDEVNGAVWHASYIDGNGYTNNLHYRNIDDVAQQVAVSLLNEEEYYPMTDEAGNPVSWEDAGLYNNFIGLKATDFEFDKTDWRYYFKGSDEIAQKMISSASPYEFEVSRFGLIIESGELLGIYAESKPSFTVVEGYKAIEKLYSYVNCGEGVEVPEIAKFEHNPATTDGGYIDHDILDKAIENMRALESYRTDVKISSHMATGYTVGGYIETVVNGDYFFQPYAGNETITLERGGEYGFHDLGEGRYNSYNYDSETDSYVAARAYDGDMKNAKASFAFASEIFTSYSKGIFNGKEADLYFVNESMCNVATTFYYGVGNDMPLYGLFAMRYEILADYTPYVVVQDEHIVQTGYFYFLGDMYGEMVVNYYDFNTAELPDEFRQDLMDGFVPRVVPSSWNEHVVINETEGGNREEINAEQYFSELLGEGAELPYFGEILGDTFGFALANYRSPGGISYQVKTVAIFYDVTLEADRSIDGAIKRTQEFLVQNGFTKNQYGEYVKGDISVLPYDSSLDFLIYVWKTV